MSNPNNASDHSRSDARGTIARKVIESVSIPMLVVNQAGSIRYGNFAAGQFWHMDPQRLRRYNLKRLFGAESLICVHFERALQGRSAITLEPYHFSPFSGSAPLKLLVHIDPVVPEEEGEEAVVLSFWDQTQRGEREDRAQAHRMMDSINLMVQHLAHELHNPLSGVKGVTQLLARKIQNLPELDEYPAIILKELERMERLVKNLLLHRDDQPLHRTHFNLHALLDDVIWFESNSSEAVGIKFVRDYDPSLPDVYADKDKLHQVFLNLIRNALEASPPNTVITVRTKTIGPWLKQELGLDPPGVYYLIEVEDQGEGVNQAQRQDLFTPFFTSKKTGAGLGLSISCQIVRAHSGIMNFRPKAPSGAVFSVALPLGETNKP